MEFGGRQALRTLGRFSSWAWVKRARRRRKGEEVGFQPIAKQVRHATEALSIFLAMARLLGLILNGRPR